MNLKEKYELNNLFKVITNSKDFESLNRFAMRYKKFERALGKIKNKASKIEISEIASRALDR